MTELPFANTVVPSSWFPDAEGGIILLRATGGAHPDREPRRGERERRPRPASAPSHTLPGGSSRLILSSITSFAVWDTPPMVVTD